MGDYTKLIVTASLKKELSREELEAKIAELNPGSSYYHTRGEVTYLDDVGRNLTLVCQTKYSRGQQEFLEWLRPYVTQGCGENEIWAIQIWETGSPVQWTLSEEEYRERN